MNHGDSVNDDDYTNNDMDLVNCNNVTYTDELLKKIYRGRNYLCTLHMNFT